MYIYIPGQKLGNTFYELTILELLEISTIFFNNNSSNPITVIGSEELLFIVKKYVIMNSWVNNPKKCQFFKSIS